MIPSTELAHDSISLPYLGRIDFKLIKLDYIDRNCICEGGQNER